MKPLPEMLKLNHGDRKAVVPHKGAAAFSCSTKIDELADKTPFSAFHTAIPAVCDRPKKA